MHAIPSADKFDASAQEIPDQPAFARSSCFSWEGIGRGRSRPQNVSIFSVQMGSRTHLHVVVAVIL